MLGFLERTVRLAANTVTLPLSIVADAATLGGELTDRRESYTGSKLKRMGKDASRLVDDVAG